MSFTVGDALFATNSAECESKTDTAARTALGLAIGTDVQAYDALLTDISAMSPAQGAFIFFDGSNLIGLAAGTAGEFLQTQGGAANPIWVELIDFGTW